MEPTTLFIGMTREVTFAGLPLPYLVTLIGTTLIGFLLTDSFIYVLCVGLLGYGALRALAMYDPKIGDVWLVSLRSTPVTWSFIMGEGVSYRA